MAFPIRGLFDPPPSSEWWEIDYRGAEIGEQMIFPLQGVPTVHDLPNKPFDPPAKFIYSECPDEVNPASIPTTIKYVMACGICNKHCLVTRREYMDDIMPICSNCELRSAEMSAGDIVPDITVGGN
jgi:hypothetical protein